MRDVQHERGAFGCAILPDLVFKRIVKRDRAVLYPFTRLVADTHRLLVRGRHRKANVYS